MPELRPEIRADAEGESLSRRRRAVKTGKNIRSHGVYPLAFAIGVHRLL